MTNAEKIKAAINLMKESCSYYDRAEKLMKECDIDLMGTQRPIELWHDWNNARIIPMWYIVNGVQTIADAFGAKIENGSPYNKDNNEYFHVNVCDIEIYQRKDNIAT